MRTLAIGDVHGCSAALDRLLELVRPTDDDTLVTLGDYIDRGPDSKGVLDRLIALHARGNLIPLRGNHEVMMLAAREQSWDIHIWLDCGGRQSLKSYNPARGVPATLDDIPPAHWRFIEETCVDWYETDTHLFAHACVEPGLAMEDQPTDVLHWQPVAAWVPPHRSGKVLVCGHTSQKSGEVLHLGHLICIDTFAHGGGWLTCLEVGRNRIWQANQRGQVRSGYLDEPVDLRDYPNDSTPAE
jgi:serine/threonine protein phosphatase 1